MRWHAIKVLEQDETVLKRHPVDTEGIVDRSYEKDIINEKYDFIEEVIDEVLVNKSEKAERTEHVDRYMTGKMAGTSDLPADHGSGLLPDLYGGRLAEGLF